MKKVVMPEDIYSLISPEQSFLSRSEMNIFTVSTNSQALELHRSEKTDLIIAYLETGGMAGDELCRIIRADPGLRAVSVILVCGDSEAEVSRCINCGANAHVTVPVSSAVLLQEAHRLLNISLRSTCRIPAKIRLECETRGKRFAGIIENISTSGLFFRTTVSVPEGSVVHCTFAVADSRQVTVSGEVVRILSNDAEAGYGVSFFDISSEAASAILHLLKTGP